MLATGNSTIIIGGYTKDLSYYSSHPPVDVVAKYTPAKNEWKKLGSLITKRHRHGAIKLGDEIFVVGGCSKYSSSYSSYSYSKLSSCDKSSYYSSYSSSIDTEVCKITNSRTTGEQVLCSSRKPSVYQSYYVELGTVSKSEASSSIYG